jgi:hypothetical protein
LAHEKQAAIRAAKRKRKPVLVLVVCEESQVVCKAFRALGHEAYSCDLKPCSGGHPEWHKQYDCRKAIVERRWDIIILHPPCTYTALCGNRWYWNSELRKEGAKFCEDVWNLACSVCDRVALEQPKTIMQRFIGKRTQVIHPWMFGHGETKETWLWLKNLDELKATNEVGGREHKIWKMAPSKDRSEKRSKTYTGIGDAMALFWGTGRAASVPQENGPKENLETCNTSCNSQSEAIPQNIFEGA